jgi:DNA-binding response OmpR family regulator
VQRHARFPIRDRPHVTDPEGPTAPRAVLVLTRERQLGILLTGVLAPRYRCAVEAEPTRAADRVRDDRPAVVIVDLASLEDDGLQAILDVRSAAPDVPMMAVVGTRGSTFETAAYALGVTDVVHRQAHIRHIAETVEELDPDQAHSDAPRSREEPSPATGDTPIIDEPTTVLVIEDEPGVRRLLERILTRHGYAVLSAADGQQALEYLERPEVRLVFLDLFLPKLGGLALLRRIRELPSPPRTIIITGLEDEELKQQALEIGAFDYLQKPLSVEQVLIAASAAVVLDRQRSGSFWERWKRGKGK